MTRFLFALLPIGLVAGMLNFNGYSNLFFNKNKSFNIQFAADDIQPTATQRKVETMVAEILGQYHYRKVPLNDSLSSVIFDEYIKNLDFNRSYFVEADLKSFEKYRLVLDDHLMAGDLSVAYVIYNVFRKRFSERYAYCFTLLKKPFKFNIDESLQPDREKSPWAKNTKELDEIWRKVIKSQLLSLKIAGKADTAAVKQLTENFKRNEKYYNNRKSDDVFQIFMNSFTESVDPHTTYFNQKAAQQFNQEMSQSLEGIGAVLQMDGDYITIKELMPGGPAFKSQKFTPGDRITAVAQGKDGLFVDIVGWFVDDAVKLIRGAKGTQVRLKILSAKSPIGTIPKEISIIREKIKLEEQSAKSEIIEVTQNGKKAKLGLITLPLFYRDFEGAKRKESDFKSTSNDVKKFLLQFETEKVDGVVMDLRNNGGGSLEEAILLTGLFITNGPVVQRKSSDGEISVKGDVDNTVTYAGPLAVLTNRFSASASEIFAGAIQDYKRGIIVGEQTYGKGTVQSIIDLREFLRSEPDPVGQIKVTMEKFYRVTGSSTQLKGVTPDFEFPSVFSANEYGESSQKSALPWDMIKSSKFVPTNTVTPTLYASLMSIFQERLKTNQELIKIKQDVLEFQKKSKTVISLQEEKRKKEIEEQKKKLKDAESIVKDNLDEEDIDDLKEDSKTDLKEEKSKKTNHDKDIYLKECNRILTDLIQLNSK
ncbi:MAG: carboxy terminal-processing peptidase [Pseudarcicella sp.]|nr:carboxy terminal-processing peptidase [Pseudarcicella sp.]